MPETDKNTVEGYIFTNERDAELARAELAKVRYLRQNMNSSNPEAIIGLYNKAVDGRTFVTPIGYAFLHELRSVLVKAGYEDRLSRITLFHVYSHAAEEKKVRPVRRRVEPSRYLKLRSQVYALRTAILVFVLVIIAMIVMSITGKNPTILNYENQLVNKYSAWEQELKDREAVIREKEHELDIE